MGPESEEVAKTTGKQRELKAVNIHVSYLLEVLNNGTVLLESKYYYAICQNWNNYTKLIVNRYFNR